MKFRRIGYSTATMRSSSLNRWIFGISRSLRTPVRKQNISYNETKTQNRKEIIMGKDFDDAREELDKIEKKMRKIRKKQIMLIDRIEVIYDDFKRVDVAIGKRSILSVEYAEETEKKISILMTWCIVMLSLIFGAVIYNNMLLTRQIQDQKLVRVYDKPTAGSVKYLAELERSCIGLVSYRSESEDKYEDRN